MPLTMEDFLKLHSCEFAMDVWDQIKDFQIPFNARLTDRETLKFSSEAFDRSYYFEIDVLRDGTIEWFYRNRNTGESSGTEDLAQALAKLKELA